MVKPIVLYPSKILNYKTDPVSDFSNEEIKQGLTDLVDTCLSISTCAGLAANQIGLSFSAFVIKVSPDSAHVIVNPIIKKMKGKKSFNEGCLSLPGVYAITTNRADRIEVEYQNELGIKVKTKYDGFHSIVFQHEYDHIQGRCFIEHIKVDTELQNKIYSIPNIHTDYSTIKPYK